MPSLSLLVWIQRVHAFAMLVVGSLAQSESVHEGSHYQYSTLIPASTSYCYAKLMKDGGCCLDEKFAGDVTKHVIRRYGAEWTCAGQCDDAKKGLRGEDLLWIPHGATCDSPRVLWIHGGGWMYENPGSSGYDVFASKISSLARAVVMVPDYPLAPIGDFSSIMKATVSALRWLSKARLGPLRCSVGTAPLFVAGDSSGGGTALSVVLELKVAGGWNPHGIMRSKPNMLPRGQILAGAILFSPWTNLVSNTPDYYYNAFAKIVDTSSFSKGKAGVYVGDIMFRDVPYQEIRDYRLNAMNYTGGDASMLTNSIASPYYATKEELGGGGIPPLYFVAGGSESSRGDTTIVAEKIAFFGAEVYVDIAMGMWHVFPMYSEGCGGPHILWPAQHVLNRTAQFINNVASAKRKAVELGLLWPPAKSYPTSPRTSNIYDLSERSDERVFPEKMLNHPIGPAVSTGMLGKLDVPISSELDAWFVFIAVMSVACGSLLTISIQKFFKIMFGLDVITTRTPHLDLRAPFLGT
eukprot:TRINITY_DN18361_c0_g1_i1.p1 TRINITY_DN18361_c0_g1~~TRINITY_DN18361_c0_g1_i1.p1  ORF type:complete len:522 (+),score=53.68 TRINITY_DN18361_c0_g1_i1:47-1612(+)